MKTIYIMLMAAFLGLLIGSCSKDLDSELADNGNDAAVNFYFGADAFSQQNAANGSPRLHIDNMVFINDSVPTRDFKKFPQFDNYLAEGGERQYPSQWFEAIGGGSLGAQDIYFMRIMQGQYRFIYTSLNKVFLQELKVDIKSKSYNTIYLAESPESDSAYTALNVPVELKGLPGKVRIQVVHLGTYLEPLDVVQIASDGNSVKQAVARNLPFGSYSQYFELDVSDANEDKMLTVQFRKHGSETTVLVQSVPAVSGSVYTLIVQGFARETTRYVKIGSNNYAKVNVSPSLRVKSRRVY